MYQQNEPPELASRLIAALDLRGIPVDQRVNYVSSVAYILDEEALGMLDGERRAAFDETGALAEKLKVNHDWLRHGKGPILAGSREPELAEPMVLCYVPARAIPHNVQIVDQQRRVSYTDYMRLAARLAELEAAQGA